MRILYVTTISLTMNSFFKPHIEMLVKEGNHVDIACNSKELQLDSLYSELGCCSYQIDFSRSPLSPDNVRAYGQLNKVIKQGSYDIVHCHTPNASVITRLVCRKYRKTNGLKVFYTAHGFHFYKGAPMLNWLVYYPIEKYCSRITDKLLTINREDYVLASTKFFAKEVYYVPGVGVDLSRFLYAQVDRKNKRKEIGVPEDATLLISVGELNENKNHQVIVKALASLADPSIHYAIAGIGDQHDHLLDLAEKLGVSAQVHLLGYRTDVPELNHSADVFCFPSIREGLGLAGIEAMACGLPVVAARNRGTKSFIIDGKNGFIRQYDRPNDFASAISILINDDEMRRRFLSESAKIIADFSRDNVLIIMQGIYK